VEAQVTESTGSDAVGEVTGISNVFVGECTGYDSSLGDGSVSADFDAMATLTPTATATIASREITPTTTFLLKTHIDFLLLKEDRFFLLE
jgi:hypothetical protein